MFGKCYRVFFFDFVVIYVGFKLLLFFDYVVVDLINVGVLMVVLLVLEGLVFYFLKVFKVGEDIFFVDLVNMVSYLKKMVEYEEFILVDVFGKL